MNLSPRLEALIEALRCLPGVGRKSAQRMAFQLLERDRDGAEHLSGMLRDALEHIGRCERCQTFSETPLCPVCADDTRNPELLCVVESPADLVAIEQSGDFRGYYFVLLGHLSPIDGIGPEEIGVDRLLGHVHERGVRELIMATNVTVEGDATAHYIADRVDSDRVTITRPAQGLPVGGELGVVDGGTLSHALRGRRPLTGQAD